MQYNISNEKKCSMGLTCSIFQVWTILDLARRNIHMLLVYNLLQLCTTLDLNLPVYDYAPESKLDVSNSLSHL